MPIFRLEPEGGSPSAWLYAGGWTREAVPRENWAVIDLTGTKAPSQDKVVAQNASGKTAFSGTLHVAGKSKAGPWLALPIKDFDVPSWNRELWDALAVDVAKLLLDNVPVLVACVGGHGRTGLAVCILTGILRPDLVGTNPIKWLRENYCDEAVETRAQVSYVFEILGLPNDGKTKGAKSVVASPNGGGHIPKDWSKVKDGEYAPNKQWNHKSGKWEDQPAGSSVGPSKDKAEAVHSGKKFDPNLPGWVDDSDPKAAAPGGTGTDEYTPRQLEALQRLARLGTGFWEDDQGKVVDVATGEKFTWDEIEIFNDSDLNLIAQNHWTEWEETDGKVL